MVMEIFKLINYYKFGGSTGMRFSSGFLKNPLIDHGVIMSNFRCDCDWFCTKISNDFEAMLKFLVATK